MAYECIRPSYKTNDPRGWCGDPKRGAALGRCDLLGVYGGTRLVLRRIRVDSGGYDPNGTYFGVGRPLYWCADDSGQIDFVLRADREEAKRHVRDKYPQARFYR
jgi:hypothetical protein